MEAESQPKITMYRGSESTGHYVWSPFVTKLEMRFRLASMPYTAAAGSLSESPKGKIPYIRLSNSSSLSSTGGELMSDSALIIQAFTTNGYLPDLNARLTAQQQTADLALRALIEDKLYFYNTRERWIDNYYTMRDKILQTAPWPVRVVVGLLIYRGVRATLHGQGVGRLEPAEMAAFRLEIWRSLDTLLAEARAKQKAPGEDEPYWVMGGSEPTEVDCSLYSFINGVLVCTAAPESRKVVKELASLMDYTRRIHGRYFPDYVSPFDEP